MYRHGHIGMSLIIASPFAALLGILTNPILGGVFLVCAFATGLAPDLDFRLPFLSHRGASHTVLAAAIVSGGLAAFPTYVIAQPEINENAAETISEPVLIGGTFALLAAGIFVGYVSHLLADMLTVSGVAIWWPFRKQTYSIYGTRADSVLWNWGLFAAGVIVLGLSCVLLIAMS